MSTVGRCDTCGYLLDVPHNSLCAELIGTRHQLKQQQVETDKLARTIREAWPELSVKVTYP